MAMRGDSMMRAPIPEIALRFSPDRQFLADGKDAVTVQAFLMSGEVDTQIST